MTRKQFGCSWIVWAVPSILLSCLHRLSPVTLSAGNLQAVPSNFCLFGHTADGKYSLASICPFFRSVLHFSCSPSSSHGLSAALSLAFREPVNHTYFRTADTPCRSRLLQKVCERTHIWPFRYS